MPRIYELRTYRAAPGRLDDLHARFRDYTLKQFAKHGLDVVAFWTPDNGEETLHYLLSFEDRQAADEAWARFFADEAWNEIKAKTEANGPLVVGFENVFLTPTDYSPLQ